MAANASSDANRAFGQIAREILAEAAETDRREDELYGAERGDELPEHLRTREGRRKALREAKERLERKRNQPSEAPAADDAAVTVELDPRQFVTRPQGRRAWVREGRRALEAQRERAGRPIAKDRIDRQRGQACLAAAPLAVVLPIPGTLSIEHLRENLAALALELGEVHDITA